MTTKEIQAEPFKREPLSKTTHIQYKDLNEITRIMENHHALFYRMWEMGSPRFTRDVPTAGVVFEPTEGKFFTFVFNPDFWDAMDNYQRSFVIAHECLHVLFNHGMRFFNKNNSRFVCDIINRAADVVINESLVNDFGFDKEPIVNSGVYELENGCWIDTVFEGRESEIEPNRSTEYYFNKIMEGYSDKDFTYVPMDDHGFHQLPGMDVADLPPQLRDKLKEVLKDLDKKIPNHMKKNLNDICDSKFEKQRDCDKDAAANTQVGQGTGHFFTVDLAPPSYKKKWETIVLEWAKHEEVYWKRQESFLEPNRRMSGVVRDNMMPNVRPLQFIKKDKVDVWMFQDTSGSCYHLAQRFFNAARSLDPKKFNVRVFCFDTDVYETDLKSGKVYGGGGTCFKVIEDSIQGIVRAEKCQYPKAVFVLTDGEGTVVHPMKPKNWHWFLTQDTRHCIPTDSKVYNLSDYE